MLLGASVLTKAATDESVQGLIIVIVIDAFAWILAIDGLEDMVEISGRGANLVRLAYPFLYPVTLVMNTIALATSAFDIVEDFGRLSRTVNRSGWRREASERRGRPRTKSRYSGKS